VQHLEYLCHLSLTGSQFIPCSQSKVNLKQVEERLLAWKNRLNLEHVRLVHSPTSSRSIDDDKERHRREITELRADLNDARSTTRTLKKDADRMKKYHSDLQAALRAEISMLKAENRDLKSNDDSHVAQCWKDLEQRDDQIRILQQQLLDHETTNFNIRQENEQLLQHNNELLTSNEKLRNQLQEAKDTMAHLTIDKQNLLKQKAITAKEIEQVMEQVRNLQDKGSKTTFDQKSYTNAQLSAERLDITLDNTQKALTNTKEQLSAVSHDRDTLSKQLDEANIREDELRHNLRESEKSKREMEQKISEVNAKMTQLKLTSRKREEDYFTAKQLLEAKESEIKDLSAQFNRTFGEKEQVSVIRKSLEHQTNQLRSECDRHIQSIRHKDHEIAEFQVQLKALQDDLSQLKQQFQLLGTVKAQVEREKKELSESNVIAQTSLRATEDSLKQTRKDLETATHRYLNLQEQHEALQNKVQMLSQRLDSEKRDATSSRHLAESQEKQLATLEMQYKQVLVSNKELDHKVKSFDTRLNQKRQEIEGLEIQRKKEQHEFNQKLSNSLQNVQELDKQLIESKAGLKLLTDERDRLVQDNKKLLHKLDRQLSQKSSIEERYVKANEAKEKLEKKCKEYSRFKQLYEHAIESSITMDIRKKKGEQQLPSASSSHRHRDRIVADSADGSSALVDTDLVYEYEQLMTRCKRLVQSAIRYVPTGDSISLSEENLISTEGMLEALEVVFSALCRRIRSQSSRDASSSDKTLMYRANGSRASHDYAQSHTDKEAEVKSLFYVHRQMMACSEKLSQTLQDLSNHHFVEEEALQEFTLCFQAMKENLSYFAKISQSVGGVPVSPTLRSRSGSASPLSFHFDDSGLKETYDYNSVSVATLTQTYCSFIRFLQRTVHRLGSIVMSKYKSVVVDIQEKTEKQMSNLESEVAMYSKENGDLKDRLAKLSILVERSERFRQKHATERRERRQAEEATATV
jgi:chromosome segregation ATPase